MIIGAVNKQRDKGRRRVYACVCMCVWGGLKQMQRGDTLQVNLIDSPVLGGDMAETTEGAKLRMSPCTLYVCVKRGTVLCDTKSCRDVVCVMCVSAAPFCM